MISKKRQGDAGVADLAGHVARWGWPVHGPRPWTGAVAVGPPVHRGPGSRAGLARGGGMVRGGGAMAAALQLAVGALRCKGGHGKGTFVLVSARRARCARLRGQEGAGKAGARGGAARRQQRNFGEVVCAKEREREGGRRFGGFLTSTRRPWRGPCRRGLSDTGD